jgi:hypothetical protein
MITIIRNDKEKQITAENGKVLTNGGEFINYPTELIVNINDNSWYEIEDPQPEVIDVEHEMVN